jgi:ADP-heptose:LPS heptosyltransferase
MNTRSQIVLDQKIGGLLCYLLRFWVRLAGMVLRINHRLDRPFERIVVCKFKGMGSIVQASALLNSLRQNYPQAELYFLTTPANKGILASFGSLKIQTLLVDDRSLWALIAGTVRAVISLWRIRPQLYLDLEVYSNYSSLVCTLSCATNRIGFYKSDKEYRSGLYTHLMYYNIKAPISEIYLQMLRLLPGKPGYAALMAPEFPPNAAEELGKVLPAGVSYMVINPNASDLRLERRWGPNSFKALIGRLLVLYPQHYFVFTGAHSESEYVASICASFSAEPRVLNSAGRLSLNGLFTLLNGAQAVITNDTGPLHLALAYRKPTVGLFGPCSPQQYGQMESCVAVYKNVYCSPCVHEFSIPPCRGNNTCMQLIEVEEVLQALSEALHRANRKEQTPFIYQIDNQALGFVDNRN